MSRVDPHFSRSAVKKAHDDFKTVYDLEIAALAQNDNWNMISLEQQEHILDFEGIAEIALLSIGDDSSLIGTLEETPLTGWKTKINALPQQFSNAAFAAAMLLEPKTQNIKLTSGTLKTEDDIKSWVTDVENDLLTKIKDGPIVIS